MTHHMFTDSVTLMKQLRKRFFVPLPSELVEDNNVDLHVKEERIRSFQSSVQKRIQLKVMKALRDWMKHYWAEDFDEAVQEEVEEWLKELAVYNELDIHNANCIWIRNWYQVLEKEYSRLKQVDWDRFVCSRCVPGMCSECSWNLVVCTSCDLKLIFLLKYCSRNVPMD